MTQRFLIATILVLVGSFGGSTASGQFGAMADALNGLSSMGVETIPVKPSKIRLVMWVKAEGTDAKSAIKALAAHRTRVESELKAMKAEESSIQFSPAEVKSGGEGNSSQTAYMRRSMIQMMQQSGQEVEDFTMPETFVAKAAVKAEWNLPVSDGDALALLPATLSAQIEARDLAGENNKAELDGAAKEKMEEMQAMMEEQMGGYYSDDSGTAKKMTIMLVADVNGDVVQQATKKAYEKAVAKAEIIASATGQKLGKLKSLYSYDDERVNDMISYDAYGRASQLPKSLTQGSEFQVVSESLDGLNVKATVVLSYELM